jgi:hypothetical protein
MPPVDETPKTIKPFTFHGVSLDWTGRTQANGDCPLCGRDGKFYVEVETGLWDCKVCGASGNPTTFLQKFWERSYRETPSGGYADLAADRGLLDPDTLVHWQVARSVLTGEWLVPGFGTKGTVVQLYRYTAPARGGRMILLATPGIPHGFHRNGFDGTRPDVYVCEGPWDAMALWEVMSRTKKTDDGFAFTGSAEASLLRAADVIAVPGANVFHDQWAPLVAGKRVHLMFDSDHPVGQNGSSKDPAGLAGVKRVANVLSAASDLPKEVLYLKWGEKGYDPALKSGYDVRDHLTQADDQKGRMGLLGDLLGRVAPIPAGWVTGQSASGKPGAVELKPLGCTSWRTLVNAWRKGMRWPESGVGLDHAMAFCMACIASTETSGSQLWGMVVAPPSTGKSSVAEALSIAREYVFPKDTLTGLFSGYQVDNQGSENLSLAGLINNKTMVVKDADTILQSPALPQILSQLRALYDRAVRTQYKNKMSKDWEGLNSTVLLFGTNKLRDMDSAELGARFLTCSIMDEIDLDEERAIQRRVAHRTVRNMRLGKAAQSQSYDDADLVAAKRLTGGYVEYLRRNADSLLAEIGFPDEAVEECERLALFVAYMRARPSGRSDGTEGREMSPRLTEQLVRLAMCLGVVLNKRGVDREVMARVRRVAFDTAYGLVLRVTSALAGSGQDGHEVDTVSMLTGEVAPKLRDLLRFMKRIGVSDVFTPGTEKGWRSKPRWRLTPTMRALHAEIERGRGVTAEAG